MYNDQKKYRKITRATLLAMLACSSQLDASSTMTHRVLSSSPVIYRMMDSSKKQSCFEIEPIYSKMYDSTHVNENIILDGKTNLIFDQQGNGDVNPMWFNLIASNSSANYRSTVTFTPSMSQAGALLHAYGQSEDNFFADIRTAMIQCRSGIAITEAGGGNGLLSGIMNAQQALSQDDWNYGKIGASNHTFGLDNIELRIGKVSKTNALSSSYDMFVAGFGILEIPTGSGTQAEWLFEPQVGTNHWGLGFGFEALVSGGDDLKFMIAANYRYLIPAWETRSFDLIGNGQWSRYLSVQDTYGLPTAPATLGLPGINFFTQQARINGRSELNIYTRLQKQYKSSTFELSYNFLCTQQETINSIKSITPGYGIYALFGPAGGPGGAATANGARINQDMTPTDPVLAPVAITNDRFDKKSACATTYASNTLAARLEIQKNNLIYGFGGNIETALSASALSSWSVWAQFGFLFDTVRTAHCDDEALPELYDLDRDTSTIVHHPIILDRSLLPHDVAEAMDDTFEATKNNFEFFDEDSDSDLVEQMSNLQKNLIISEINLLQEHIAQQEKDLAETNTLLEKQFEPEQYSTDLANLIMVDAIQEQDDAFAIPDGFVPFEDNNLHESYEITQEFQAAPIIIDHDTVSDMSIDSFEEDIQAYNLSEFLESKPFIFDTSDNLQEFLDEKQANFDETSMITLKESETISLQEEPAIIESENGLTLIDTSQAAQDSHNIQEISLETMPKQAQKAVTNLAIENEPKLQEDIKAQSFPDGEPASETLVPTLEIDSTQEPVEETAPLEKNKEVQTEETKEETIIPSLPEAPIIIQPLTEAEILEKLDSKK